MSMHIGAHDWARSTHGDRVLQVLRRRGALTRGEIAKAVGVSRSTLSEVAAELLALQAIAVVAGPAPAGRGRPAQHLALDPRAGQIIGIDFSRHRVQVVVSNPAHEIVASVFYAHPADLHWSERIAVAMRLLDDITDDFEVHFEAVRGVGVGIPGYFGDQGEPWVVMDAPGTLENGADRIRSAFRSRFPAVTVCMDNNSRLAALAEAIWDNHENVQNLMYIRLSHGVGGGLVIGGGLVSGASGAAGEFGHIALEPLGTRCRCGKRGCLETLASTAAVFTRCSESGVPIDSIEALSDAAAKDDPIVVETLRRAGEAVGKVLAAVGIAVSPSQVVIGGELARFPDLVEQARRTIAYELQAVSSHSPTVRLASLGDEGGALGAISALLHSSPLLTGYPTNNPNLAVEKSRQRSF